MAYELKTKKTDDSVASFLNKIEDEQKRKDCFTIVDIMQELTGFDAKMWGAAIVGFGSYHYKYASGHEGDMCLVGFSPRKANITLYLSGYIVQSPSIMEGLGKFKTGKGCLYINKLSDVNMDKFRDIIQRSIDKGREHAES